MISPKERVRKALNHEEPDRVPICFFAHEKIWQSLKDRLSIKTDEELVKRLGVDLRYVAPKYIGPKDRDMGWHISEGKPLVKELFGIGFTMVPCHSILGEYYEPQPSFYPLAEIKEVSELNKYEWPSPDWFDRSNIKKDIEQINKDEEYWVFTGQQGYQGIFETAWSMRGFERLLMDLAINPELACGIMDKIIEFQIEDLLRTLEAGNGLIDMVYISDDIGGQEGMFISPEIWRRYIRPREQRIIKKIRQNYNVKITYHSCGSIYPVIPDLIEIGVDVINYLQLRAKDMDPVRLKREHGDRLCFQGGVDVQHILPYGTKEEVRNEVKRLIKILGRKGGYILGPSEAILPDTKLENIIEMYNIAHIHEDGI